MDLFKKVDNDLLVVIKDYLGCAYTQNERLQNAIKFVIPPIQTGSDYSTNVAMVFSKALGKKPFDIANELCEKIKVLDFVQEANAINGYINITFKPQIWEHFLADIENEKEHFGDGDKKEKVLLEFISANPTGPFHIGHGRWAAMGSALANLLKFYGHDVYQEFYINDAGSQIQKLGRSLNIRVKQELGENVDFPEDE